MGRLCRFAAVIGSALALVIGLSRRDGRGIALALVALIGGGLIAYVPWHYDQLRHTLPPIHDIATDPDNPPALCRCGKVTASIRSSMKAPRLPTNSGELIRISWR